MGKNQYEDRFQKRISDNPIGLPNFHARQKWLLSETNPVSTLKIGLQELSAFLSLKSTCPSCVENGAFSVEELLS